MNVLLSQSEQESLQQSFFDFCRQFTEVTWRPGESIIEAGRSSKTLYYLTSGCVKMSSTSSLGDTVTLHIFYPDSCFPLLSLVNTEGSYDFNAIVETKAHKIPTDKVVAFLQKNPSISLLFNLNFLRAIKGLLHRIEQSVFVSAYYQVAGILYYFSRHFPVHGSGLIKIKVTHKDISEWLGLSRENVSLQMKQLERNNIITRRGQLIEVVNPEELKRLATPQDLLL